MRDAFLRNYFERTKPSPFLHKLYLILLHNTDMNLNSLYQTYDHISHVYTTAKTIGYPSSRKDVKFIPTWF